MYICRICLKSGVMPIYGGESYGNLSEVLNTFCGLNIQSDDIYPKYLCNACYIFFKTALEIRKLAKKSDKLLRNSKNAVIDKELQVKKVCHYSVGSDIDIYNTADDARVSNKPLKPKTNDGYCNLRFESDKEKNSANENDTYKSDDQALDCNKDNVPKSKKIFICRRCDLKFETLKSYHEHTKSKEHTEKRANCQICNKSYKSSYLKQHMALHLAPPKTEVCDICGKIYEKGNKLMKHRLTHFDDLPFKCSLCPYRGRFPERLKMHMRIHTGEKPYSCVLCPEKTFISKSNLNTHMLTHKDTFDYTCEACSRGFHRKWKMEQHIKIDHMGIKEHVCNICDKPFGYRKQMMKHQLNVHKREKLRSGTIPLYIQIDIKRAEKQEQSNKGEDVMKPNKF